MWKGFSVHSILDSQTTIRTDENENNNNKFDNKSASIGALTIWFI